MPPPLPSRSRRRCHAFANALPRRCHRCQRAADDTVALPAATALLLRCRCRRRAVAPAAASATTTAALPLLLPTAISVDAIAAIAAMDNFYGTDMVPVPR